MPQQELDVILADADVIACPFYWRLIHRHQAQIGVVSGNMCPPAEAPPLAGADYTLGISKSSCRACGGLGVAELAAELRCAMRLFQMIQVRLAKPHVAVFVHWLQV